MNIRLWRRPTIEKLAEDAFKASAGVLFLRQVVKRCNDAKRPDHAKVWLIMMEQKKQEVLSRAIATEALLKAAWRE
jgi:hypothetical protein